MSKGQIVPAGLGGWTCEKMAVVWESLNTPELEQSLKGGNGSKPFSHPARWCHSKKKAEVTRKDL